MNDKNRLSVREKILEAAAEIARESGAGNITLEAVAARAGVSKGGLLYHFSSKARLLEAAVEQFVNQEHVCFQDRQKALETLGARNSVARAYIDLFDQERMRCEPPPTGLLAALAENPNFLKPVQHYECEVLKRMKAETNAPELAMIALLAIHGIRAMQLLNIEVVDDNDTTSVINALRKLLDEADGTCCGVAAGG
ncbi:TetR/AcrR family transcriptional regulator [Nitratireductor indicus]|uniref:TetR family transcriptional regulator n=1 Tax=Nitratireductor indicus C115 TaxID=1231190 RepID=K2NZE5_9HYPH|nr:TetR/AcrR family transcriptional regulator [Nitratireductor indicus]EKF43294.1 TetR family transcriptional regulator [Nitratireductor indicus C115]MDS1137843.1 TetR/AcrR family transcriptional regulator [Nitratireductor indicus]SFQ54466.1 transcriptional regulator, TetR family [Nitratireductor indicus]